MNFDDLEAFNDDEIEEVSLNIELVRKNIPTYNSQKLCEMIVCDRYFGFNQEISIMCMEELGKRRMAGDSFEFENYIEESMKGLPVLDFSGFDIRNILNQAINQK